MANDRRYTNLTVVVHVRVYQNRCSHSVPKVCVFACVFVCVCPVAQGCRTGCPPLDPKRGKHHERNRTVALTAKKLAQHATLAEYACYNQWWVFQECEM